MILRNRNFNRVPASKDAKNIYIFCEGGKREYDYFIQFKGFDSRINIEVYKITDGENNSPQGLFEIAQDAFGFTGKKPIYEFIEGDEVWLVFDVDPDKLESRVSQMEMVIPTCKELNWNIAISNPCFEVWLYFHFKDELIDNLESCSEWKSLLGATYGGFDSRQHFVLITNAISRARKHYKEVNDLVPDFGRTRVFSLGEVIVEIMGNKIEKIRDRYLSS